MTIVERGVAVPSTPHRPSNAFPALCAVPGGRWLCGFRAAPTKGAVQGQQALLCWSDDEGRTWTDPIALFTPPELDGHAGVFRAAHCTALGGASVIALLYWVDCSDPSRTFFDEETECLLDSKLFLTRSADNGETWSDLELLDTSPYDMPTPATGPILLLGDGRWALQFELNKPYLDPEPWRHASVLMFSSDGGRTWPEHVPVTSDPANRIFYWDQRPGVLADGTLLDLFWTYDRGSGEYLNIHARQSPDHGRTWSDLWDTGLPGQPAPPVSLPDGRSLLVYVDRTGAPVIKARTSADGGRSWPDETELVVCAPARGCAGPRRTTSMAEAWEEMSRFSVGLPTTAALPDGDVLVVYYHGPQTDQTAIEWVRLRA